MIHKNSFVAAVAAMLLGATSFAQIWSAWAILNVLSENPD